MPTERVPASRRRSAWWSAVLLFLFFAINLVNYRVNLTSWFYHDDYHFLYTTDLPHTLQSFTTNFWDYTRMYPEQFYRPLQRVIFLIEYTLFGYRHWCYALAGILVHTLNGFLLLLLAQALGYRRLLFIPAVFLFYFYPFHNQPVTWVSAMPDLYVNFFGLLALLGYFYSVRSGRKWPGLLGLLCLALALLTKEAALSYAFIILLHGCCSGRGRRFLIPALILLAVYAFLYLLARDFRLVELGHRTIDTGFFRDLPGNAVRFVSGFYRYLFYPFTIGALPALYGLGGLLAVASCRPRQAGFLVLAFGALYLPYTVIKAREIDVRFFYTFSLYCYFLWGLMAHHLARCLRSWRMAFAIALVLLAVSLPGHYAALDRNLAAERKFQAGDLEQFYRNAYASVMAVESRVIVIADLDKKDWLLRLTEQLYYLKNKAEYPELTIDRWFELVQDFYWHQRDAGKYYCYTTEFQNYYPPPELPVYAFDRQGHLTQVVAEQ